MAELLKGGWFPEQWDVPVALGLGVVITGFLGDYVASFIGQWIPAGWLNPVSELIIGFLLFMLGGILGGDMSRYLRLFSFGAFAVGIADAISILLGLAPAAARMPIVVKASSSNPKRPGPTYPPPTGPVLPYEEPSAGQIVPYFGGGRTVGSQEVLSYGLASAPLKTRGSPLGSRLKGQPGTRY